MLEDKELLKTESLSQFFQYMDKNAVRLNLNYALVSSIAHYKEKTEISHEKEQLVWEMEFFLFEIRGNILFPLSNSYDVNKEETSQFPDKMETKRKMGYLKKRAETSESNLLKAKYHHLLWMAAETKNKKHAMVAIHYYDELIADYFRFGNNTNSYVGSEIQECFELITGLSGQINHFEQVKRLKNELLFHTGAFDAHEKIGIIETMLAFPKVFKAKDFENIPELLHELLESSNHAIDDFHLVENHIPIALKVVAKKGLSPKKWYLMAGHAYVRLAEHDTRDAKNFMNLDSLAHAIHSFGLAGALEEKKKAEQSYFELKPKVKLDTFVHPLSEESIKILKETNEELKVRARELLKRTPDQIYKYLSLPFSFPKYEDAKKQADKTPSEPFLQFAKQVRFDTNKNIRFDERGTDEYVAVLREFGYRMEETMLPFLHHTFFFGIRSGHLTYLNFLEYFLEHTWIGKPHLKFDLGGNPIDTNWANLLAPAVLDFFNQILAWGTSTYYVPNFVLCVDSLTLKLEGLFRNFCERLNVPTSEEKEKGMQEVLLHRIFDNKVIKEYFDQEDLLLFDYAFSDSPGLNLRNNIAHSFFNEKDYTSKKMLLLIAVLLRLGKYNISQK